MSDSDRRSAKKHEDPSPKQWLRRRWRPVLYVLSFVIIVAAQTLLYWWGMRTFEGDPRTLLDSFDVIVQSLTTTGYGQDAPWESSFVNVLVIVAQFTGIAYLFVAFPLFIVPWIEDMVVEPTVPEVVENVDDHVVLAGEPAMTTSLVEDLVARDRPHVIVESDDDLARDLYEDDYTVVEGDPADEDALRNARVAHGRAVVVDATTDDDVGTVLLVADLAPDVEVVCLVDDPAESQYLRRAGAGTVLSPKHRLGKSLADKARNVVPTRIDGPVEDAVSVAEFPVAAGSDLFGRRLAELDELATTGATLLGAWVRGEFVTNFSSADRVDESTLLVAVGSDAQLDRVGAITGTDAVSQRGGPVVVLGQGIAGLTAAGILRKADCDVTVVAGDADVPEAVEVDVAGDPADSVTVRDAGVADAGTVVVALPDDEDAVRAALLVRDANPEAELVVAVDAVRNASKLYRAGATAVFPLPRIAARMTMLELFDEDVTRLTGGIRFERFDGAALGTSRIDAGAVRDRTGAVPVAVERAGEVQTRVDDVEVAEGDVLVVAGTAASLAEFEGAFCP